LSSPLWERKTSYSDPIANSGPISLGTPIINYQVGLSERTSFRKEKPEEEGLPIRVRDYYHNS
jgi:hypothetical protein